MFSFDKSLTSSSRWLKRMSRKLSMTARNLTGSNEVASDRKPEMSRAYLSSPAWIRWCDSGSKSKAEMEQRQQRRVGRTRSRWLEEPTRVTELCYHALGKDGELHRQWDVGGSATDRSGKGCVDVRKRSSPTI